MNRRAPAIGTLLVGGVLTGLTSVGVVGLLREGVRYGCQYTEEGEGRGWFCADGVGYILPWLGVLFLLAVIGGIALVVVIGDYHADVMLPLVAALPLAVGLIASASGIMSAGQGAGDRSHHIAAWLSSMVVAAPALAVGAALAVATAVSVRRSGRDRSGVLAAASAAASLVAVIAQPGLMAPMFASWAILVAGLLRVRSTGTRTPRRSPDAHRPAGGWRDPARS